MTMLASEKTNQFPDAYRWPPLDSDWCEPYPHDPYDAERQKREAERRGREAAKRMMEKVKPHLDKVADTIVDSIRSDTLEKAVCPHCNKSYSKDSETEDHCES